MNNEPGHRYTLANLVLTAILTLATVAGVVVAVVVADKVEITSPGRSTDEVTAQPPRTVTETVTQTETVTVAPPVSAAGDGPCDREPNEERIEARLISLGTCEAGIETENDRDWYMFESPAGGQFKLTVQKERTSEEAGTIIATVYDGADQVESEHVASDEPFVISYTLAPEGELAIELIDGCSPGGCGVGGYLIELEQL